MFLHKLSKSKAETLTLCFYRAMQQFEQRMKKVVQCSIKKQMYLSKNSSQNDACISACEIFKFSFNSFVKLFGVTST